LSAEAPPETSKLEADATPSEPRTDPAAVLKRILAIIRAPGEPAAASIAVQDALPSSVAATPLAEPVATPEAEPVATAAAVSILAPAAGIVAAGGSGPDEPAADVLAVEQPAAGGTPHLGEPVEVPAPKSVVDDAADDILMPLSGPLTVDQAVDAMLK